MLPSDIAGKVPIPRVAGGVAPLSPGLPDQSVHMEVGGRAPAAADGHLPCQKMAGSAQLSGPRRRLVPLWPAGPCSVAPWFWRS